MNRRTLDADRFFGALRGALSPVATSEPLLILKVTVCAPVVLLLTIH